MTEAQRTDGRSIERLVEHVRTLPIADQAELVRRITPLLLADLDDEDREELVMDLNQAIIREAKSALLR